MSFFKSRRPSSRQPRSAEEEDVSVRVLELEPTQAIVVVTESAKELHAPRRVFLRQRVRIGNVDVGVPSRPAFPDVARVVGRGIHSNVLEHDHRGAALDDAEEEIVRLGPLKGDLEAEPVAIERERLRDAPDDEEGRDGRNGGVAHATKLPRKGIAFNSGVRDLSPALHGQYVGTMTHHRQSFTASRLLLVAAIVGALSAAFPSHAQGQFVEGRARSSRNMISAAEIEKYGTNGSVHDLVHALRRQWLNVKQMSIRETPTVTAQGKAGALVTPAGDATLMVYLDRTKVGDMESLRSLPIAGVVAVRYYTAAEALRRWGSGHEHGAIEVLTASSAETP